MYWNIFIYASNKLDMQLSVCLQSAVTDHAT
jgi:hypothetical protein